MMQRRIRLSVMAAAAAWLLPSLQACYEYKPITSATPKTGESVALEISDRGRVGLSDRFGPGLASIEGKVVSTQPDELVINVYKVSQINGQSAMWSGETTRLDRSFLSTVKAREFSRGRTALVAGIVGGAAVLLLTSKLVGSFGGPNDEGSGGEKPVSIRIPITIHLRP